MKIATLTPEAGLYIGIGFAAAAVVAAVIAELCRIRAGEKRLEDQLKKKGIIQ